MRRCCHFHLCLHLRLPDSTLQILILTSCCNGGVQELTLVTSSSPGVYTGTIKTLKEPFWQIISGESPPRAEVSMSRGDGRLGPLNNGSAVNITYVDQWPRFVHSVKLQAVSAGEIELVGWPMLSNMTGLNHTLGLVLHKTFAFNASQPTNESRILDLSVRSHSMSCRCRPGTFCAGGDSFFLASGMKLSCVAHGYLSVISACLLTCLLLVLARCPNPHHHRPMLTLVIPPVCRPCMSVGI